MSEPAQADGIMDAATITKTVKRRNRCCCSLLHVTTATLLIGCLELCYFSYEIFSTIYHFVQTGDQYLLSLSISLFGVLLALVASVLLFIAIKTSTPYLLVPHLLMQVKAAAICVLSLVCLFCLFALIAGTSLDFRIVNMEDNTAGDLMLSMMGKSAYELIYVSRALVWILSFSCIFLLILGLVQVWMLIIVFQCFFHLQEKAILKTQCADVNRGSNGTRAGKRQICAANAKKNNFFSLEMNSTKYVRNN
uniref:Uncharacterized protein n=1 Tax=Elaeophora elaphi TaxID=1147741 RepID=A0A158Q8I8_9BILA